MQTKQNKALKALYNLDFMTPTRTMHKLYNIPLVTDLSKLGILKFIHIQTNNKTPEIFDNIFIQNTGIHTHNTRQAT